MRSPKLGLFREHNLFIRGFMILLLSCITVRLNFCISSIPSSLRKLPLEGHLNFDDVKHAARDFGNRYQHHPMAVLHPKSVSDIAATIKHIWQMGPRSQLTVAARGHGHSLQGQAQAHGGVVINMESIKIPEMLHLTVGGTLSNAGISGQAFRHGPQISNVQQQNGELFHSVLGGLGQFGIITRARISLEPAPTMVKWIRVLYADFTTFTKDQELLISVENAFDYIEGFVIINRTGLLNNWRSSFNTHDPVQASKFKSDGRTLFCLELAKYFDPEDNDETNEDIEKHLSHLHHIPSTLFLTEVTYVDFLDRVHISEVKLRSKGLWDVPHPWLNVFIPKSQIHNFAEVVFGNILTETSNGPVLIYPVNKSKWDNRSSVVIPEEDIFYLVAFLTSAVPSSSGTDGLEHILNQNRRILEYCERNLIGVKQYLPHYTTQEEWRDHFGPKWELFLKRKSVFDPLAILAPGQRIFQKATTFS